MNIYKPTNTPDGFKRFNNISDEYYMCKWNIGETEANYITREDDPLAPPTYPNIPTSCDGVATLVADGWQHFLDTVESEGITIPEEMLIENDENNI